MQKEKGTQNKPQGSSTFRGEGGCFTSLVLISSHMQNGMIIKPTFQEDHKECWFPFPFPRWARWFQDLGLRVWPHLSLSCDWRLWYLCVPDQFSLSSSLTLHDHTYKEHLTLQLFSYLPGCSSSAKLQSLLEVLHNLFQTQPQATDTPQTITSICQPLNISQYQ